MKVIVYTRPDGGLSVVHPAPWARLCKAITPPEAERETFAPRPFDQLVREHGTPDLQPEWAETEQAFAERIRAKDVPADATDVQIVDQAALPADRDFRAAWKAGTGAVQIDMPKAVEIHKDRLRALRAPLLEALDVQAMRALEAKDEAALAEIATRKQALRDVTKAAEIAAATTPEELKAAVPAVLVEAGK